MHLIYSALDAAVEFSADFIHGLMNLKSGGSLVCSTL
jgi:hypothetical protein